MFGFALLLLFERDYHQNDVKQRLFLDQCNAAVLDLTFWVMLSFYLQMQVMQPCDHH